MTPFKFLETHLLKTHDGHYINADEWFYSVNKEPITSPRTGKVIPKYTIVQRIVPIQLKHKFKPDHELLWYFKSRQSAYWLIDIWKGMDKLNEWELKQRRRRTR